MKTKFLSLLVILFLAPVPLLVDAVPPRERLPLEGITISGAEDTENLKVGEQVVIRTEYSVRYLNTEYIIIFQIKDESGQVVSLSWIEGDPTNSVGGSGSYVCGEKICFDQWAVPEPYVCGEEICQKEPLGRKFAESSWIPLEPGKYEITLFAWEAINNPTALSPPVSAEVTVL